MPETVLQEGVFHLGVPGKTEWEDNVPRVVDGERLELKFQARANPTEYALRIRQQGVKLTWPVLLNGRKLGVLSRDEAAQESVFAVGANLLKDGENVLSINAPPALDDVDVGPVVLSAQSAAETISGASIAVRVRDSASGSGIPCRLTLTKPDGTLQPLSASPGQDVAARTGVVYTREGRALLGVPPGDYILYAGRGFEWSVERVSVHVERGSQKSVELSLTREVPTEGWVAADSHIHTLTHSGHGDATSRERILTIAGEGIEVAIATDHNHHTDYAPVAREAGLAARFTPVVGNEITTAHGHFNAFPISPGAPVVDFKELDWERLLPAIRATPGVRVVTLNHPRDLHAGFVPFGEPQFNPVTGEYKSAALSKVDAVEVVTSGALQSDIQLLYRDWFALLNRGVRIAAVAASDTHDVSRFILGQARTYVAADDSNPAAIPLEQVWDSYARGKVLVSMGLLAKIQVNGRFEPGDLVGPLADSVEVRASVYGPSWVTADKVALYANGECIREQALPENFQPGQKASVVWTFPKPVHDVHLVVIASGPGVTAPYWEIPRPYQPSSPRHRPRIIGSTNPVWLDCDGSGKFESAFDYARTLVERSGGNSAALRGLLQSYDKAVGIQAAALLDAPSR